MSGRGLVVLGVALAVIALERMLSAALVVSTAANEVSIRMLAGFVCGGLAPLALLTGYLKMRKKSPLAHARGEVKRGDITC